MARVSDFIQQNRLNQLGVNIRTVYFDGDHFVERNTDNSRNDNVIRGIRHQKSYFHQGVLKHNVENFDTRILYTYFVRGSDGDSFQCPNCGATIQENALMDTCPHCKTYLNIDYDLKSAGAKVTYDYIVKNKAYKFVALFLSLAITTLLMFLFIRLFGRTYNIYDKAKAIGGGLLLGIALYFLFYRLDALVVLGPIRRKKEKQNRLQMDFWQRMNRQGISQLSFFNDFNYELGRTFYSGNSDIIDYDILDYEQFEDSFQNNALQVTVKATIRTIHFNGSDFHDVTSEDTYHLIYTPHPTMQLNGDADIIHCQNCGASINALTGLCPYCMTPNDSVLQWHLVG